LWNEVHNAKDISHEDLQKIKEEVADIFIYLLYFCNETGLDLVKSAFDKMELNETKYPIEKAKGSNKKYTESSP